GDADDDAERREEAAELVEVEVADPHREHFEEERKHGGALPVASCELRPTMGDSMSQSIFSKIIARQIPAKIEFEDDKCIVIHDIQPAAPVHLLVVPKKEIATLNELTPGDEGLVGHLFLVAKEVMGRLGHKDYRAVFNCGAGAQ